MDTMTARLRAHLAILPAKPELFAVDREFYKLLHKDTMDRTIPEDERPKLVKNVLTLDGVRIGVPSKESGITGWPRTEADP